MFTTILASNALHPARRKPRTGKQKQTVASYLVVLNVDEFVDGHGDNLDRFLNHLLRHVRALSNTSFARKERGKRSSVNSKTGSETYISLVSPCVFVPIVSRAELGYGANI